MAVLPGPLTNMLTRVMALRDMTRVPDSSVCGRALQRGVRRVRFAVALGIVGILCAIAVRRCVFRVSGLSMYPSYRDGAYIVVLPLYGHFRVVGRGSVIVIKNVAPGLPFVVKRVVGLPGDCIDAAGSRVGPANGICLVVPSHYLFVEGDNRFSSQDSRDWGPVKFKTVYGLVLFPPVK